MNRFRAWGLSAAVAAGAGAPAAAADPPARPPGEPTTLMTKLFGPPKRVAVPPAAKPAPVAAPLPAEVVNAALKAEQDAWNRRMAVFDKLRQTAADRNDDDLMRQVDEMERQATAVYAARVAALGVARPKPAESAAAALDRQLGTGAAVTPLTAPAPPAPVTGTASAKKTGDAVREVKP